MSKSQCRSALYKQLVIVLPVQCRCRYVIRIGGDLSPLNRIYFPNIALHVTSFEIMVVSCKAIFLKIYVRSDIVGIICFWGGISDKKNHKFNLEWSTVCESHWRRGHETREIRRATLLWNVWMLQGWTQNLQKNQHMAKKVVFSFATSRLECYSQTDAALNNLFDVLFI